MVAPGNFSSGDVLTADALNAFAPICALQKSSQSIPNGVFTEFTFGAGEEIHDPYAWHSTVSNTERIVPDIAGIYLACFNMTTITGGVAGRLNVQLRKNGSNFARVDITAISVEAEAVAGFVSLNGTTDYVSCGALQTSGVSKTFNDPTFTLVRIAGS